MGSIGFVEAVIPIADESAVIVFLRKVLVVETVQILSFSLVMEQVEEDFELFPAPVGGEVCGVCRNSEKLNQIGYPIHLLNWLLCRLIPQ